ncbi:NUDIX domain-containing protein [Lysobacter sp. BMK333-48F3]|uniref:NUDIX domain-containing protein n=1 Tax=Lysobacter sp. BMK333-48F3 TaxID=2867962 RepID=UPI001C8BBE33|nr:NUDIX domain-containing protein [Lysobacter sp. BMK333-48F3]MBX9403301.1 NUDIX domain-containing protein [Lysobacter sp. BMK333-48F3]
MSAGEHRIGLVGALLMRDGQVLLGLRAGFKRLAPNRWDMLGGHVEPGESPEQALRRELEEEAGVRIRACAELAELERGGIALRVYRVDAWDGEPQACGDEHRCLHWFEPAQAAERPDLSDPWMRELLLKLV